jgi:putative effector of murein hydrolase LrgA (UPF0299 family)
LALLLHSLQPSNNSAGHPAYLLKELSAMYLLFVPPVVAFVGIFAISLRNQFADRTNL